MEQSSLGNVHTARTPKQQLPCHQRESGYAGSQPCVGQGSGLAVVSQCGTCFRRYSTNWSTLTSTDRKIAMPNALAVFMLTTNSNWVG